MKYSKRTQELQTIYQLTPQEVFYCMLVSRSASQQEAYIITQQPRSLAVGAINSAIRELNKKPGITKLINSFGFVQDQLDNKQTKKETNKANSEEKKERERIEGLQFTEKSEIVAEATKVISQLAGKDRIDAILKIGTFQQLNKEKNEDKEQRVYYYLPLSCCRCDLYKKAKKGLSE